MRSPTISDRLWSTSAITHILSNADTGVRRALQSKNVVGLLIERLLDEELEIQVEACGALRNLAIEGGSEVCAEVRVKKRSGNPVPELISNTDVQQSHSKIPVKAPRASECCFG